MKVIDILNKIANNEEIGKINIIGMEYYIDSNNFLCDEFNERVKWCIDDKWLNMPVEIIEDKKIQLLPMVDSWCKDIPERNQVRRKINEIIDYINKGEIDEKNK